MCFSQLTRIPTESDLTSLWQTYFYTIMKESGSFKRRNKTCERFKDDLCTFNNDDFGNNYNHISSAGSHEER